MSKAITNRTKSIEMATTIRIVSCKDSNYWYADLIGKVTESYTIEGGNAILREEEVCRLLGNFDTPFKAYIFAGDYEIGEIIEYTTSEFKPN